MTQFNGDTFVITGAARGQGAEQARRLISCGAVVFLTDLLVEQGSTLATDLGASATFIRHDVSSEADWIAVMAQASNDGRLRGLVNNAGVHRAASLDDTDPELMEYHFQVNQLGTLLGMKHAVRAMKTSGGSIVNIASSTGLRSVPNHAAYGGTKWAIRGMTKSVALEVAPFGIRVNSVHPGLIDTPMLDSRRSVDLAERMKHIPLGRLGKADDVASVAVFLLSDDSSYITGAEIAVDGGLSL